MGCDDELFVHIRFVLFVIVEYLFEFPIDVLTAQPSGKDGTVGSEKEDVGDAVDAVELQDRHSRIEYLRIGNVLLTDIFEAALRFLQTGDTHDLQTFVLVFAICCHDVRYLLAAGAAPRSPEIDEHVLATTYIVAESLLFAVELYGEIAEHRTLTRAE